MSRSFLTRLAAAAAFAVALACAWRAACLRWWPLAVERDAGEALPGLRVGGTALAPHASARAQIEALARAIEQRRVRLVAPGGDGADARVVAEPTFAALGVTVDVGALTARALRLGRAPDADLATRAKTAERARRGEIDLPIRPEVDPGACLRDLLPLKEDLDRSPVPARLDLDRHAIIPEQDGRALDVDAAIAAIARAAADPRAEIVRLPFAAVPPRVTAASLAAVDVSHVLASFTTYFSRRGDQRARAQNIEVAASHVDGLVMQPGELVSFNDTVGARSGDNGFQKAFEIFKGEMVEGTGGGTCQVASTLHAAAFFAGLDVVQRLPHSRPSAYIPVGLDATVAYPVVDLKLRNPYTFPVVVHATVGANDVTVKLLGADKPARVALMRTVLSTTPFDRKVVEDSTVDRPIRKQKGADGMTLLRKRLLVYRGGATRVETSHDTYPPTTEIWRVPPGFDESSLPPVGEDAPSEPRENGSASQPPPAPDPEQTIWGG